MDKTLELSGQRIFMYISADVTEDGYWDVRAESTIGIRAPGTDWHEKNLAVRSLDKDIDLAMSTALVSLMEQVATGEVKEELEAELLKSANEQA